MQNEVVIQDREQAERIVREIAEKTLELLQERTAMDRAVVAARAGHDKRITTLEAAIKTREELVAAWAEANRDTEFNGQSLPMRHGVLSFRQGNWFVNLVEGWTWDGALEQLRKVRELRRFVRRKPEIDKRKLLQEREETDAALLEKAGLSFARVESFSIEPKIETVLPLRQAA